MSKITKQSESAAPFTREEIIQEARLAALGLASHIASFGPMNSGINLAAEYLGVELESYDYEGGGNPQLEAIPIEGHFLFRVVMDAYDHAYQCGPSCGGSYDVSERLHEVAALLAGFPQTDFNGESTPLDRLNPQKLRQVLDTFIARCVLDDGGSLTIPQLALLANMGEAAVRTSLSAAGIKTIASKDAKNQVPYSEAITWLGGRRHFVPTRHPDGADPSSLIAELFSDQPVSFEAALDRALVIVGGSRESVCSEAGCSVNWFELLLDAESHVQIDLAALSKLASVLGAPVPLFVGRAVTALLSRQERLGADS